uniref:Uncharacterized protein n=1 Tax=Panagrolaimus sp. PS1159 TaxID=55785 RepID=A0AC35GAT9_9BILA
MSDSDEYEKIEDFNIVNKNSKEEAELNIDSIEIFDSPIIISQMEDSVNNIIQADADIHINEIVAENESGSESNDSYIYYTDEELYESEKFDAVSTSTAAREIHEKSVNVTNQKIKELQFKSNSALEKESAELDAKLQLLKDYRKWLIENSVGPKSIEVLEELVKINNEIIQIQGSIGVVEELVKINNEIIQIQGFFDDSETQTSKLQKALAAFKAAEEEYAEFLKEQDKVCAENPKDEQQHEHFNVLMNEPELAVNECHMKIKETKKPITSTAARNSQTSSKKQKNDYSMTKLITNTAASNSQTSSKKQKNDYCNLINAYNIVRNHTKANNSIGEPNMQKKCINIFKPDTPRKSKKQILLEKKNYMDERIKSEKMLNNQILTFNQKLTNFESISNSNASTKSLQEQLKSLQDELSEIKTNLLFAENNIENKYNVAQEIADILENECKIQQQTFDDLQQKTIEDSKEDMKQKDATIARLRSELKQARKEFRKHKKLHSLHESLEAVKIDKIKESEQNLYAELAKAQQQIEYYQKLAANQAEALKNFNLAKSLEKQLFEVTQKAALGKYEVMDLSSEDLVLKRFKDDEDYNNLAPLF